jgi:hypothetical protein
MPRSSGRHAMTREGNVDQEVEEANSWRYDETLWPVEAI